MEAAIPMLASLSTVASSQLGDASKSEAGGRRSLVSNVARHSPLRPQQGGIADSHKRTSTATPGHPPLRRHFKVCESDQAKARELVRQYAKLGLAEHCEPVKELSTEKLAGMRPGEVRRHS
jgi:hypothetical protein